MSSYLLRKTTDVEALGASEYPAIAASKQGPDLPLSPYLFKTLTARLGRGGALLQDDGHQEQAGSALQ